MLAGLFAWKLDDVQMMSIDHRKILKIEKLKTKKNNEKKRKKKKVYNNFLKSYCRCFNLKH